ncbi:MAG TPA: RcnB family protein [Sphingomicrobium sp.]|nr:RcnB family protein [Sphingomicrobium sp.]
MRKTLISLLLASAVVPSAASAQDWSQERGSRTDAERSERPSQRDNAREARSQRADRVERSEPAASSDRAAPVERTDRQADRSPRVNRSRELERASRSDRMQGADRPARTERADRDAKPIEQAPAPVFAQPVQQSEDRPDNLVDGFRQVGRDIAAGRNDDHDSHDRDDDHDWKRDWRKDKRYDWWNYRNSYRSLYRLGNYYDPYGWGYRRWSIGYSLWPSYYGSNYWLNDPSMYRLPPVYGPYRWVRYYDDAVLVNIYTGHVVDVIYNFFW